MLRMRDSYFKKPINLIFASVGKDLDLRGVTMPGINLSGARIAKELRFDDVKWQAEGTEKTWMILRNTAIGALRDAKDAWPSSLDLDGFSYERLGGFGGDLTNPMANREVSWWKQWLLKSETFSSQPYAQLAATLAAHGNRKVAADIRFFGQEREREQAFHQGHWSEWSMSSLIALTVGYGIGDYTFRAAYWVTFFALLGAGVLWFCAPAARMRGAPWCVGASLSRLLPIVRLNREFDDFFDDPRRERLTGWQLAFFAGLGLIGWALGLFLVAAMTGVMQK
jgi:hypothetical protein